MVSGFQVGENGRKMLKRRVCCQTQTRRPSDAILGKRRGCAVKEEGLRVTRYEPNSTKPVPAVRIRRSPRHRDAIRNTGSRAAVGQASIPTRQRHNPRESLPRLRCRAFEYACRPLPTFREVCSDIRLFPHMAYSRLSSVYCCLFLTSTPT